MSARSFTVFQDSPTEILQPVPPTDATASLLSTLAAIEKENLHPVTGERTGPASSEGKKRKTAVLSTKLVVDLSQKPKEKYESTKKRKQPSSSGKPKSSDARKSSQSKRRRSPPKASPLPPVQEEPDVRREPSRLDTQATINSKCYDLTVSPLADVSEAYETVSQSEQDPPSDDERPGEQTAPLEEKQEHTPKRDHISSQFTFSSPSPSSERFRQAQTTPTRRGHSNL